MARKKVTLEYIPQKKIRCDTLKKRSKNMMKKAGEVSTLCNTKACVIVYPEGKSVPQVFSSHDEAVGMLHHFRSMNNDDPFNKKMDQECFLNKCIGKLQKEALKSRREREENDTRLLLHKSMRVGHAGLSMEELTNVGCKVDVFLKGIHDRITKIGGQPPVYLPYEAQMQTTNFTSNMDTTGDPTKYHAQASTPCVIGGMDAIGAPTMYKAQSLTPYVTIGMDTVGSPSVYHAQAPTPYVAGGMSSIGASTVYHTQAPSQQHEEWRIDEVRGWDLGVPIWSGFNGGTRLNSAGAWFSHPWGGADACPSSRAFPSM